MWVALIVFLIVCQTTYGFYDTLKSCTLGPSVTAGKVTQSNTIISNVRTSVPRNHLFINSA